MGGNDIDNEIVKFFCEQNEILIDSLNNDEKAILYKQAEKAKISLSYNDTATMILFIQNKEYKLILTNKLMAKICYDLFERVKKIINQAVKNCSRRPLVNDVILVGGSSQIIALQDYLSNLFGRKVKVSLNPDTIIALGIGAYTGIKLRDEDIQDIVMTDVCPFSLGVGARLV